MESAEVGSSHGLENRSTAKSVIVRCYHSPPIKLMTIKYEDLQPHVEMLIDALENRGASSSGFPNEQVYPYAQKYRDFLKEIRDRKISRYNLEHFLNDTHDEIMKITNQPHRTEQILGAMRIYFYKEFMVRK